MSTILNETPAIRLFDSDFNKLPEVIALDIAQALRASKIILSGETLFMQTSGLYEIHQISYEGNEYRVGVPKIFDPTLQYTYDGLTDDGRIIDVLLE